MTTEHANAFVLHARAFRETSLLVDVWIRDTGLTRAIAKGARGKRRQGSLDLFQPLSVQLGGKGELKNVYRWEARGRCFPMLGRALASGLYLNELLVRLLPFQDPHEALFELYETTIEALCVEPNALQPALRRFELKLLDELGYGLNLAQFLEFDWAFDAPQSQGRNYCFDLQLGWRIFQPGGLTHQDGRHVEPYDTNVYDVIHLAAIAREAWHEPQVLATAKRLSRHVFALLLGDKPLASRRLLGSGNMS